MDERGNRTERRRASTGAREAGWAWDIKADKRRHHVDSGGCDKEDRRPQAGGVSQDTETAQKAVGDCTNE